MSHFATQHQIHSFRQLFKSVHRLRSVYQALDQISQTLDNGGVPEPRMSASHLVAKVVGTRSIDKLSAQFSCRDLSADEGGPKEKGLLVVYISSTVFLRFRVAAIDLRAMPTSQNACPVYNG